ncbi:LOW QUALITY PROTEIN: tumor necrosis factor receptor superfamily member 6 [Puntigrus tetrazona]|uniref:LOW QUALITY PROTEIN: tumor necrosis factor receptor superfamily member 6 n=1 Tax=Puntigrus tetrazona TaxID=1606681 RepID=UPI001C891740|nr:LOW QUALITY PROTEIN: tumor necrosis factor receptor superfamily member 6 [Puntigrus tetrazona]
MYAYNLVVFLCVVVLPLGLIEGSLLRTRRGACEHGTYQNQGNTCCLCSAGYRVLSHCTDETETKCQICEDDTFIDHNNNDEKCHRCKYCDSSANMDTKVKCSRASDTVCGCKEGYYCGKNDLCKACYPCDKCEKNGEKERCTETHNTVCQEPVHSQSTETIVAVLVLLVIAAGVGVLIWLWKKKKLCFKDKKNLKVDLNGEDLHLNDVDLNPYLSEIADVLTWKTMKHVAQRNGMSKADIEQHQLNHPEDVKEQTFELLQDWSQRQGLYGAYSALINTLHCMKQKRTADEIRKIVEKEAMSQP